MEWFGFNEMNERNQMNQKNETLSEAHSPEVTLIIAGAKENGPSKT